MQCIKKRAIVNKLTGDYMMVDCQKCNFCLQNRRSDWGFRMQQETKVSGNSKVLTLTYDNKHLPQYWEGDELRGFNLEKEHLFRFLKTIKQAQRRALKKEYKYWRIRYYAVGEYGSITYRPHYHVVIFNIHPTILERFKLGEFWDKGEMRHVMPVNIKTANYVAKYLIDKQDMPTELQKPFTTMSRNPGIGANYIDDNGAWHREYGSYHPDEMRMYRIENGFKKRLPRYYKNKIFKAMPGEREDVLKLGLEMKYEEIKKEIREKEKQEIERLAKILDEPEIYIEEQKKHHHDQIRIKSLKLNRL